MKTVGELDFDGGMAESGLFAKPDAGGGRASVWSAVALAPLSSGRRFSRVRGRAVRAKAAVNAPHSRRFAHAVADFFRASALDCAGPRALFQYATGDHVSLQARKLLQ